ncbi:LysM peptidoglycan-binding domain-containing protein [Croceimicrobium sp.]|uniref:lytic transglycosylase domain-containing protein n=1 Tax=Croceimicrobium sp. TaxID=2828340 RepID=UPI003BABCB86
MKLKLLALGFGLAALPLAASATQPSDDHKDTDTIIKPQFLDLEAIDLKDHPVAARLDSLLYLNFFQATAEEFSTLDSNFLAEGDLPDWHDSVYEARLKELDALSPMDLDYNPVVRSFIDLYSKRRREQVSRMLGLARYYFPLFEQTLDKYNMPLELKYLAVVESALNPTARSRVGAAGLWQFMYSTGKLNGLSVNSYVDERHDPIKSTEAACRYLTTLYNIFGDWNLALAAYNSGPGNVNKAIRRSGGQTNYWAIRPFLPRETAGYVPAFIAVNYIMNYHEEHLLFATDIKPSFFSTDTVVIREKVSFEQLSKLIAMDEEELLFLNPAYRYKIIPKVSNQAYRIVLPADKIGLFIANEDSIYSIAENDFAQNKTAAPAVVEMNDRIRHKVRRGEVLGTIAEKYGVSVSSIRRWNGLRGNTIRVGQRLTIYPRRMPSSSTVASNTRSTQSKTSTDGKYEMYRVRSGETFYSIARKYPGVSAQNIMSWNGINNAKRLKVGMTLKIYPQS